MKKNCWVIILAIVLFSCQKDTSDTVTSTAEVDVYVAGFVADDANSSLGEKPAYWKNGSLVQIDGYVYGYAGAKALSIAVSGNDVYVAGYKTSWSPYRDPVPHGIYWKNGIQADVFTRSGFPPWAYELSSLVVSNNDVYMVGWFAGSAATYYKNESPIDIPDGSTASSIAVSGNDVYVCGEDYFNGIKSLAVYWKNGNRVNLTDGSKDAYTTSIAVSGNDVYVAGSESNGTKYVAKYWKNGKPVNLTDGSTWAEVNSITVSGSDVYVAGLENGVAKYWKNGSPVNLTDGLKWAEAKSIAVSGNDVYAAGFEENIAGTQDYVAKYWKNGIPVILGDASKYSEAYSIFLAPK